jgi:hypothetical protein
MWHYNTKHHRMVDNVPYRLVFGQHPRVGISGLHLEQDLLDRLATEDDLNRVIEYEPLKNKFLITYNILYHLIDFFLFLFQ